MYNAIASTIGTLGSLIQGNQNRQQQRWNIEKTNQANRELAEYGYSKDLEMWERANEYNAPSAQMQRLKAAGLNPNMVYGSGGATTQAATLPKYNVPKQDYRGMQPNQTIGNLATALSMYTDFRQRTANIDRTREETNLTKNKTAIQKLMLDRNQWMNTRTHESSYGGQDKDGKPIFITSKYIPYQRDFRARLAAVEAQNILRNRSKEKMDRQIDILDKDLEYYFSNKMFQYITGGINTLTKLKFKAPAMGPKFR